MPISTRIAAIEKASRSGRSAESVPALRILGLLAERHFLTVVEALERHGDCEELRAVEATLTALESEPSG